MSVDKNMVEPTRKHTEFRILRYSRKQANPDHCRTTAQAWRDRMFYVLRCKTLLIQNSAADDVEVGREENQKVVAQRKLMEKLNREDEKGILWWKPCSNVRWLQIGWRYTVRVVLRIQGVMIIILLLQRFWETRLMHNNPNKTMGLLELFGSDKHIHGLYGFDELSSRGRGQ